MMKIKIDKQFYRTVFALVLPMALQNLINVAVQSADVVMLGKLDEVSLSAASLAGQIQFVLMLICFGLSSGASVLTAQYWGKGDKKAIERVTMIALRFSMIASFLFFLAAELFPENLMRIFSPDEEVIRLGAEYLRFVAPNYLFVGFTSIYLNILRSVERVAIAVGVVFSSLCINIVFNTVFIFGFGPIPALGVAGAAIATSLARVVEFIIVMIYAKRNRTINLRFKEFFASHKILLRDFLQYAGPTTINELLWGAAIAATSVIIGHMGSAAVAANSFAQLVRELANVVGFGVANAAAVVVGKALGAGDKENAELAAKRMLRIGIWFSLFSGSVIFILRTFTSQFVDFFGLRLTAEAVDYLGFLLLLLSFYVVAQTYNAVMIVGVSRGGGDTRFGLFLDLFVMWFGSVLFGWLTAFVFKLPVKTVYLIIMMDEFIKLPLCVMRYRKKYWLRNVTRDNI